MAMPYSIKSFQKIQTKEDMISFWNDICNKETRHSYNEFYLDLADDAFENMEILLGPKTSEAEEIIVRALVDQYCPNDNVVIKKSKIKIK